MATMTDDWFRVEVTDSDGQIVAIESEMLVGRDIAEKERRVILKAIAHLSGFLGCPQDCDFVDEEQEEAEAAYQEQREREMSPCGCKFCVCFAKTEYGEPCDDCANHAHQG